MLINVDIFQTLMNVLVGPVCMVLIAQIMSTASPVCVYQGWLEYYVKQVNTKTIHSTQQRPLNKHRNNIKSTYLHLFFVDPM